MNLIIFDIPLLSAKFRSMYEPKGNTLEIYQILLIR